MSDSGEQVGAGDQAQKGDQVQKVAAASSPPPKVSKEEARKARYAHLKIGDVIQVLTNLGWEKVIVRRKLENGKLDIVFQDGETMLQVMPRILDKRQRSNSTSSATMNG